MVSVAGGYRVGKGFFVCLNVHLSNIVICCLQESDM